MRLVRTLLLSLISICTVHAGVLPAAEITPLAGIQSYPNAILISGAIEEGDDSLFYEISKAYPSAIILLESPGGQVNTGISIGAEIAIRGYSTIVKAGAGCHSVCAVMWAAGTRRFMTHDANISVHAAFQVRQDKKGRIEATESGMANAQIGAFLNEIGLNIDVIRYFTFAGPSEELLRITPRIAQLLSLDVHVISPHKTTAPAERPTPRRISRQVAEYSGLETYCTNLF